MSVKYLVNFLCTCSNAIVSFLYCGNQNCIIILRSWLNQYFILSCLLLYLKLWLMKASILLSFESPYIPVMLSSGILEQVQPCYFLVFLSISYIPIIHCHIVIKSESQHRYIIFRIYPSLIRPSKIHCFTFSRFIFHKPLQCPFCKLSNKIDLQTTLIPINNTANFSIICEITL